MLPSQSARPSSSRSHMYRRHRSRRIPAIIAAVLLIVGLFVVFKVWQSSGGPSDAQGADGATSPSATSTAADSSRKPTPPQAKLNPTPGTTSGTSQPLRQQPTNPSGFPDKISMAPSPAPAPTNTTTVPNGNKPTTPTVAVNLPNKPVTPPAAPTTPPPAATLATISTTPTATPSSTPASPPASSNTGSTAATSSNPSVAQRVQAGFELLAQNKPVNARKMLTVALESNGISAADADRIRTELTKLNQRMIFGPEMIAGDPHVMAYAIEPNDALAKLPRKLSIKTDWRFIQRINNISDPQRIRPGQKLKIVKGPFHAVIHKPDFRMDLFMGDGADRVYVTSFKVGLGEYGATPEGAFTVKTNSKLVDPAWTNPRTGEYFASGDPNNPLGKYWIGLVGTSDNIRDLETYGIHGTVDPESIGQLRSMGCVRMLENDIALTYEVLIENVSHVEIHGEDYP